MIPDFILTHDVDNVNVKRCFLRAKRQTVMKNSENKQEICYDSIKSKGGDDLLKC